MTVTISKEMFYKVLTQIEKDYDNANRLREIFFDMKNDFVCGNAFINPALTAVCVELLDSSFGENCDWVAYWVYELDCGNCGASQCVEDADGNFINLETKDDLWNFLIEQFGE